MKRLALLAVVGLVSATVSATNWVNDGYGIHRLQAQSIDTDSISIDGRYRTAFVRTIFEFHQNTDFAPEPINKQIVHYKYDCDSNPKKNKIMSVVFFNDGKPVFMMDKETDWFATYPDSLAASAADFVCSY